MTPETLIRTKTAAKESANLGFAAWKLSRRGSMVQRAWNSYVADRESQFVFRGASVPVTISKSPLLIHDGPELVSGSTRSIDIKAEDRALFEQLEMEWKSATWMSSSTADIHSNLAYAKIIGMGEVAVPLILERLRVEPDHWFWALVAIVREDVASGEATLEGAAQRWLEWGSSRGYELSDETR